MAWNGSNSAGASVPAPKKPAKKSPGLTHGLIAGGVIVLMGIIALYFVTGEKDDPIVEKKSTAKIADAEADIETNVAESKEALSPVEMKKKEDEEFRRKMKEKYGDNPPPGVKAILYYMDHPVQRTFKSSGPHSFLRHTSERMIAGVVLAEPGTFFPVPPRVDESFDSDFVNALVDKIDYEESDTDEVRAIKDSVTEIKKEISAICRDEGKTPSEVLNEHGRAMYDLGRYQRDLEQELDKIKESPEYTDQDVTDFIDAANKMLESKGLKVFEHPDLTRRSIHLQRVQKRLEREAREKQIQE